MDNKKVKFIIDNFENYMEINPYLDLNEVRKIKEALIDNGFYKNSSSTKLLDQTVTSIILKAQNNKKFYHRVESKKWAI